MPVWKIAAGVPRNGFFASEEKGEKRKPPKECGSEKQRREQRNVFIMDISPPEKSDKKKSDKRGDIFALG